jgi:hypothetical protein
LKIIYIIFFFVSKKKVGWDNKKKEKEKELENNIG